MILTKTCLYSQIPHTIKKVTEDVGDRFNFNTAISAVMELVNEMYKYKEGDVNEALYAAAMRTVLALMAPFVPHITEEIWVELGYEGWITMLALA